MVHIAKSNAGMHTDTPLAALGMSISGFNAPEYHPLLINKLRELDPNLAQSFQVCSDTHGPLFTVSKDGGLVIIAGTGSMGRVLHSSGFSSRASGWGHLVGDEGSAYYVVRSAIELIHQQQDGVLPLSDNVRVRDLDTSAAAHKLNRYFGTRSVEEVNQKLYRKFEKDKIAGFCEELAHLAGRGDRLSCYLFEEAGAHLARIFIALLPSYICVLESNGSSRGDGGEGGDGGWDGGGGDVSGGSGDSGDSGTVSVKVLCVGSLWKSWSLMKASFAEVATRGLQRSADLYPHTYRQLLSNTPTHKPASSKKGRQSVGYFDYGLVALAPAPAPAPLKVKIVCQLVQSTETGAVGAALLGARAKAKEAKEEAAKEAAAEELAVESAGMEGLEEGSAGMEGLEEGSVTSPVAKQLLPDNPGSPARDRCGPHGDKKKAQDLFTPPRYKGRPTAQANSQPAQAAASGFAVGGDRLNGYGSGSSPRGSDSTTTPTSMTSEVPGMLSFTTAAREAARGVAKQVASLEGSIDHEAMSTMLHELLIEVELPSLEEDDDDDGDEEGEAEEELQLQVALGGGGEGGKGGDGVVDGEGGGEGEDQRRRRRQGQRSPCRHAVGTPIVSSSPRGGRRLNRELQAIARERERREKGVLTKLPTTLTQAMTQALVAGARIDPAAQPNGATWSQQATFGAATLVAGLITAIALSPARPTR
jgi:N-acetylglucosamine kinase-like BadF-type ATPase